MAAIDDKAQDILFRKARSHNGWKSESVDDALLKQVYDLCKWGPTSANSCPMRIVFVKSKEAKERLKPVLDGNNVQKAMTAPVVAIIGYDMEFYENLPKLFPHNKEARSWFAGNEKLITTTAFRNGSLQGAYFMIAARALGLDCGPMSGFDNAKVDAEFFKGTAVKSNFICALGRGDESKIFPRSPRLAFDEACKIV
jgi:3-hydroxypropanoate dehydrogenase